MSNLPKNSSELELRINYTFKNKGLLTEALTHSSYSNEQKLRKQLCRCNERLEFLGDSVLSITASEYLFALYEDDEGVLTKVRAEIVCERALAGFANQIGLGDYLLLGVGEEKNGGRESKSILSDAFEALLAAMYLDAGEDHALATVAVFLLPFLKAEVARLEKKGRGHDYKTQLQQFIQQDSSAQLKYVTVAENGPDHAKTFIVEARMGSNIIGRGEGKTKREAEQNAACEALVLFGEIK